MRDSNGRLGLWLLPTLTVDVAANSCNGRACDGCSWSGIWKPEKEIRQKVDMRAKVLKELAVGLREEPPLQYGAALRKETALALSQARCLIAHPLDEPKRWRAVDAAECWIGDHPRYVKLFKPLVVPEDPALKELYAFLGVVPISLAVRVSHSPAAGENSQSVLARSVRHRVVERACLLLHDIDKNSCPLRANLREGAESMLQEGGFTVFEVSKIASRLAFRELSLLLLRQLLRLPFRGFGPQCPFLRTSGRVNVADEVTY